MLGGFEWCPDIGKEMNFHVLSNTFLLNTSVRGLYWMFALVDQS